MDIASDLALGQRTGLPEALRVLLDAHPRHGWTEDPGFNDLIAFWLDRHLLFRRLTSTLVTDTQAQLEQRTAPETFLPRLSKLGGLLLNDLHMHHRIEDTQYFPVLRQHDPRLDRGFEILDRDHHVIDPHLAEFAEAANGVLRPGLASRDRLETLHTTLQTLENLLDRHLVDEEDLIVPVLLKFGHAGVG